jgi:hypothetical protein
LVLLVLEQVRQLVLVGQAYALEIGQVLAAEAAAAVVVHSLANPTVSM